MGCLWADEKVDLLERVSEPLSLSLSLRDMKRQNARPRRQIEIEREKAEEIFTGKQASRQANRQKIDNRQASRQTDKHSCVPPTKTIAMYTHVRTYKRQQNEKERLTDRHP